MSSDKIEIINHLNNVLNNKLASINQYFLHARIMKHMGAMRLADYEYKESIEKMKYADKLIERILLIGGVPVLRESGKINTNIGSSVTDILRFDLEMEKMSRQSMERAADVCDASDDVVSADILNSIIKSSAERVLFINSQLNLIDTGSLPEYLVMQA